MHEPSVPLVEALIAAQFPRFAGLAVRPVAVQGWDNRTFRLGPAHAVRLPSARRYVAQVHREHRWLPHLARHLPLPVPTSHGIGEPGLGYPFT